ncbi:MAG: fused response regulator/phosphatase [Methylobacterium sp.]|nr:fused response regulator/phosphatase [Methylobacterium sp.]
MKILIVDDDRITRMLMRASLARSHVEVVEAGDGRQALEVFESEQPDMVIMDVTMPVMSGYETAAVIKQRSAGRFVPIIFLTSLSDDESLAKCVDSGGDDFLSKPFNGVLLQAKISAMMRIRGLYQQLEMYRVRTEEELILARHVFHTVTHRVHGDIPGLHHWTSSAGHLSGDLVLYDKTPSGRIFGMLGDFTGHGFSAAIGALPVSDIFFAMVRKDCKLPEIIAEINRKLYEILPTGHFCAACFVTVDPDNDRVKIWNGGLPEALLVNQARQVVQRFPSRNFALGVVGNSDLEIELVSVKEVDAGSLLVYSDGLCDAVSPAGEMFGSERLETAIVSSRGNPLFAFVQKTLQDYIGGSSIPDDISMLEIPLF